MAQHVQIPDFISRPSYIERVLPFIDQPLIKVFTGQRRVGKSYLLFQLIDRIIREKPKSNIIYINKEDLDFASIQSAKDLHDEVKGKYDDSASNYLFIDEIQDIENFHDALRSLTLLPRLDIYITGSNANLLSSDLAGFLSGRYIEISVYSLSYPEFLTFHRLNDNDESLIAYLKYGGLPYIKHLPLRDEVVFEYLKNIYNSIVYRDVVNRFSVRNTAFLEQLITFLANHIGSIFSAKRISDFLKSQKLRTTPAQIQNYLHHLKQSFILSEVPRYDLKGKRVFEFGNKYYFENLGLRNAVAGFRPQDMGKLVENAVYNHLCFSGYEVKTGALKSEEIDFVAQKNGETHYFQVALRLENEETISREFGNLQRIDDNYPKAVITLDPFDGNTYQGIRHISLRKFLSEQ